MAGRRKSKKIRFPMIANKQMGILLHSDAWNTKIVEGYPLVSVRQCRLKFPFRHCSEIVGIGNNPETKRISQYSRYQVTRFGGEELLVVIAPTIQGEVEIVLVSGRPYP